MMDINKILGKQKTNTKFTYLSMSNVFGKNPVSLAIGKLINKPLNKMGASMNMQNKWKHMTPIQRDKARKKYKDSDGDRVPNIYDCSPFNAMRQDWAKVSDVPVFGYPRSYGYRKRRVEMTPDEYMDLAKKGYYTEESRNMSREEHEESVIRKPNIEKLKPVLQSKHGKLPIPVLETKRGKIVEHEGRHRAIAAKELGYETIPVDVVETDKDYIEYIEERKPTKAYKWDNADVDWKEASKEHDDSLEYFKDKDE